MQIVVVTPPVGTPVTTAEAKAHLRVEHADDDTYIDTLLAAATTWCEKYTERAFLTQTWKLVRDYFPGGAYAPIWAYPPVRTLASDPIYLPGGIVQSVSSVKYYNSSNVETTYDPANYTLTLGEPGRVALVGDLTWPDAYYRVGATSIQYVVGYGNAAAVPAPLKHAVKMLVGQLYEHREPEITGTIVSEVRFAVKALLDPYKVWRVA